MKKIIAKSFYDSGYHFIRHKQLIEDEEYYWARAEASANLYFSKKLQEKRILDYGCGIGQSIASLPNAAGFDESSEARKNSALRGIKVFESYKKIPKKKWDIIFCRHALEHIEEPFNTLKSLLPLLAPDGLLYLILPKEKHYQSGFEPDINQHLFCWNFRTINNLLNRAGFQIIQNREEYVLGYRVLLPIRRFFGKKIYAISVKLVGRILRNGELIILAKKAN